MTWEKGDDGTEPSLFRTAGYLLSVCIFPSQRGAKMKERRIVNPGNFQSSHLLSPLTGNLTQVYSNWTNKMAETQDTEQWNVNILQKE